MGFVWPAAFVGALALLVPLLIHLLQRGEHQRVTVAIARFVPEHEKLRWRRLKITQPLLLLLRLALVSFGVLLLAAPYLRVPDKNTTDTSWTLVSPRADTTEADLTNARWLAPGFPPINAPRPDWQPAQLWSLIALADNMAPAGRLTVIAPATVTHVGTRRPQLKHALNIINAAPVSALPTAPDTISINIVYDADRRADALAIKRAIDAWRDAGVSAQARLNPTDMSQPTATVWLADRSLPAAAGLWLTDQPAPADAQPVAFALDGSNALLEQVRGKQRIRYDTSPLRTNRARFADPQFARDLLSHLLGPALAQPPGDYPIAEELAARTSTDPEKRSEGRRSLVNVLLFLVLISALLERLVSAFTRPVRHDP